MSGSVQISEWFCTNCGAEIDTSKDQLTGTRNPCPCGSLARTKNLTVSDSLNIDTRFSTTFRQRVMGVVKKIILSGDSFTKKTKTWAKRNYVVDKINNWYSETVTDSDGKVIHHCSEPLDQHNKKKKTKD